MLQSRYFAAKYFSSRHLGGIPEKETVTIPLHGTTIRGGSLLDLFKAPALLQAKRKREDEEVLGILCLFAVLEDEDNGLL